VTVVRDEKTLLAPSAVEGKAPKLGFD